MRKQLHEMVIACRSWQQAQSIADYVLEQGLASRTELLPMQQGTAGVSIIIEYLQANTIALRQELTKMVAAANVSQTQSEG